MTSMTKHKTRADHVDATETRLHLAELRKRGVGMKRVAELANVAPSTLYHVVNGHRKGEPVVNVARKVHDAVLAIPLANHPRMPLARIKNKTDDYGYLRKDPPQPPPPRDRPSRGRDLTGLLLPLLDKRPAPASPAELLALFAPRGDPDELDEWQDRAICATIDPEIFFPEKGGSTREAKQVCQGCDVRHECLRQALDKDERFGIWGGLSERERRRLKRGRVA